VQTTVVGSYPRVADSHPGQRLRRAIAKRERQELTAEALRKVEVDVLQEVVREQASLGADIVTDGQVTWYDPVSHFAAKLEGMEIGGLLRYFDTNTYYRQPRTRGKARWVRAVTVEDWLAASAASPAPVKAVLTGPHTLAAMSACPASKVQDLQWDLASAIGNEIDALVHAGAAHLQIDEPAFVLGKALPKGYDDLAREMLQGKGRAQTTLFVAFGGVGPFLGELLDLPFDVLGLDLVQGATTLDALRKVDTDKGIAFGLLDARNTKPEDPMAVAKAAYGFAGRVPLDRSYLCPSNGLEFLPRTRAREKLKVLVYAAKLVREAMT
jgi:5-methyltetrahydropteroyltriglutamate--homocysteine methyltransferase